MKKSLPPEKEIRERSDCGTRMAVKRLLCLAVLLISALHVSPPLAYGQPKKLFTLAIRDAYLTELFLQIEKQSNYSFVYQTDDIEALGKKNFSCVRSDLEALVSGEKFSDNVLIIKHQ